MVCCQSIMLTNTLHPPNTPPPPQKTVTLMNVVLPVEYCPNSSTVGLASKSDSDSAALKKLPNLNASSKGLTWF
jgi:hypothetical protein